MLSQSWDQGREAGGTHRGGGEVLLSCTRTESPSHPATTVPAGAGRCRLWDPRGPEGPPGRKRLRTHLYFCLFPIFTSLPKFSVWSFISLIKECTSVSRPAYDDLWSFQYLGARGLVTTFCSFPQAVCPVSSQAHFRTDLVFAIVQGPLRHRRALLRVAEVCFCQAPEGTRTPRSP